MIPRCGCCGRAVAEHTSPCTSGNVEIERLRSELALSRAAAEEEAKALNELILAILGPNKKLRLSAALEAVAEMRKENPC